MVRLRDMPRRIFPASESRATVAALMFDVCELSWFPRYTAVPLER
jgi:hypothetical protein